jgi:nitrogen regulatory protein PII
VKMLMVLAGTECREKVELALEKAGIAGYTEVDARGVGSSGRHLGSAAFPKTSTIIMSFVADEDVAKLRAALQGVEGHASRPHVVTWTLESWNA